MKKKILLNDLESLGDVKDLILGEEEKQNKEEKEHECEEVR